MKYLSMGVGLALMVLGVLCLAKPSAFTEIDKAMTREVVRLDKLSRTSRVVLGVGLLWIGYFFLRTLPGFLNAP